MIVYEVNMTVETQLKAEFVEWLNEHIHDMETVDGLRKGRLFVDRENQNKLSAQYIFENESAMENYLKDRAEEMRGKLPDRLRSGVNFSRRILREIQF